MKKRYFIFISILLIFLGKVNAKTYYVSPAGLDSNQGTALNPFKTIQKAANIVNSGDTVIVGDGIYTDDNSDNQVVQFSRGGKAGSNGVDQFGHQLYDSTTWVTFKSENKWGAVIDGENNKTGYCFLLLSPSFIQIEGFEIKGCGNAGVLSNVSASNFRIVGNHIHDIGKRISFSKYGQSAIFYGKDSHFQTFEGNVIHSNGRTGGKYSHNDHGIYGYGSNSVIINNILFDNLSGWDIQHGGNRVGNCTTTCGENVNIINNTLATALKDGSPASTIILWGRLSNLRIQNNLFLDSTYGIYTLGGEKTGIVSNNMGSLKSMIFNLYDPVPLISINETLDVTDNELVIDYSGTTWETVDFTPKVGSVLINEGESINAPSLDFRKETRIGKPDIGAYEYQSNSGFAPKLLKIINESR